MTENRGNGQHENGEAQRPEGQRPEREQPERERPERERPGRERPKRDSLGSVAEEAAKLFDTLQRRIGGELGKGMGKGIVKGGMSGLGQAFGGGRAAPGDVWGEAVAGHHEDEQYICRACPICRAKAAARESGGEVTDHLVAAGGELFAAFRQAVDALTRPQRPTQPPTETRVEHIDLG
jgi:hypothetical protein